MKLCIIRCYPSLVHARSRNFPWHPLWLSIESKNIVKLLARSQTRAKDNDRYLWYEGKIIHAVCCEDNYFPKETLKYLIFCFTEYTLVFSIRLFSIANLFVRYLWDVRNEDNCCVVTYHAVDICVGWLVYLVCLPSHVLRAYCNFESKQDSMGAYISASWLWN